MFSWLQDWQMLFNTDKSKVVHFGFNNKEADYILGNHRLNAVEEQRDLGVIVDKSLKSSRQCAVSGMILRTLLCKAKELILQLYKSLVRPRLEYCIQAWRPYLNPYTAGTELLWFPVHCGRTPEPTIVGSSNRSTGSDRRYCLQSVSRLDLSVLPSVEWY